jgi:hypothetical protein
MFAQRTFFSANYLTIKSEKISIRGQSLLFNFLAVCAFGTAVCLLQRGLSNSLLSREWPISRHDDAEPSLAWRMRQIPYPLPKLILRSSGAFPIFREPLVPERHCGSGGVPSRMSRRGKCRLQSGEGAGIPHLRIPTGSPRELRSEGRRGFQFTASERVYKIDNFQEIALKKWGNPTDPGGCSRLRARGMLTTVYLLPAPCFG